MPEKLPGDPNLPPGTTMDDIDPNRFLCEHCGMEIDLAQHEECLCMCNTCYTGLLKQMNGEHLSELARVHEGKIKGRYLTDDELQELIAGLKEIVDFLDESNLIPLAAYYRSDLESLKQMKENRKL